MGLICTVMGESGLDGCCCFCSVAGLEFELFADVFIMVFGFQVYVMLWLQGSGIKFDKWGLI